MVKEINVDAAMLTYLSGIYNVKDAPNENYARELFELFTVGKAQLMAKTVTHTIPNQTLLKLLRY